MCTKNWESELRYFWDSITSWAYWRFALFSKAGAQSILFFFGAIYLFIEALDFFGLYTRDQYASYAVFVFLVFAIAISVLARRPTKSILVTFPNNDLNIEVRVGDLFDCIGAVVISSNTVFEADVAGKKISPNSLQGQFTARYYTGNQIDLIEAISNELEQVEGNAPYPLGTVIPITTHGKTFYFCAMAEMNDSGNASSTIRGIEQSLSGLWKHVREAGELQELSIPLMGTGRGRLTTPRRKIIEMLAESYLSASQEGSFANKLVIVIHPDDAKKFQINLWDVKDHLKRTLIP